MPGDVEAARPSAPGRERPGRKECPASEIQLATRTLVRRRRRTTPHLRRRFGRVVPFPAAGVSFSYADRGIVRHDSQLHRQQAFHVYVQRAAVRISPGPARDAFPERAAAMLRDSSVPGAVAVREWVVVDPCDRVAARDAQRFGLKPHSLNEWRVASQACVILWLRGTGLYAGAHCPSPRSTLRPDRMCRLRRGATLRLGRGGAACVTLRIQSRAARKGSPLPRTQPAFQHVRPRSTL